MVKITKATITRRRILDKAFQKIYHLGYQGTSIDKILDELDVTKGAFYYHFSNKKEMGLAVVKELVYPKLYQSLIKPLEKCEDPKEALIEALQQKVDGLNEAELRFGCPTQNLVIELGATDVEFAQLFQTIYKHWQKVIEEAFHRGIENGTVKPSTNPRSVSSFVVMSYQGLRGMSKVKPDLDIFDDFLTELEEFLAIK